MFHQTLSKILILIMKGLQRNYLCGFPITAFACHVKKMIKIMSEGRNGLNQGWRQRGDRRVVARSSGSVSPPSGKNFVFVGEFLTENCVPMHRKIPAILLLRGFTGRKINFFVSDCKLVKLSH